MKQDSNIEKFPDAIHLVVYSLVFVSNVLSSIFNNYLTPISYVIPNISVLYVLITFNTVFSHLYYAGQDCSAHAPAAHGAETIIVQLGKHPPSSNPRMSLTYLWTDYHSGEFVPRPQIGGAIDRELERVIIRFTVCTMASLGHRTRVSYLKSAKRRQVDHRISHLAYYFQLRFVEDHCASTRNTHPVLVQLAPISYG